MPTLPKSAKSVKTPEVRTLISGMLDILQAVGIPMDVMGIRANGRMAMAMLAIADLSPGKSWAQAKGILEKHRVGTRDIILFDNLHFGENINLSSYDDVKRRDLLLPENSNLVLAVNPRFEIVATNDPTRKYTMEANFADVVRAYGSANWPQCVADFRKLQPSLKEDLNKARGLVRVPVKLPTGEELVFEPGEHNQLQKAIIEDFLALYVPHCEVLYVGDAVDKALYRLDDRLGELGFKDLAHEDLPDVIVYDKVRDWIFIIEAVHSFGAISEIRVREIKRLMAGCSQDVVYVTAFLNRKAFQKWSAKIAWETEVWIADNPEHMIHYNGDKFLGPHKPGVQSTIRNSAEPARTKPAPPLTPLGF
ncbi:BsuBI/PstI family type II restriction endonuclease [Hymenobacter perfusus]|nr:BsuBI/PstI family type II restriction endonuclease [Hymenobacter perfusus]